MNGKYLCISLLFIFLCTTVCAREYPIDSFPKCYADLTVRVEAPPNNTFELKPCGMTEPFTKCKCVKNITYSLWVPDNASGNYNVFITYFINKPLDELNERTNTYLIYVKSLFPPKEPFNANSIVLITIFIVFVIFLVGGAIILIVKKIKKDDD